MTHNIENEPAPNNLEAKKTKNKSLMERLKKAHESAKKGIGRFVSFPEEKDEYREQR